MPPSRLPSTTGRSDSPTPALRASTELSIVRSTPERRPRTRSLPSPGLFATGFGQRSPNIPTKPLPLQITFHMQLIALEIDSARRISRERLVVGWRFIHE